MAAELPTDGPSSPEEYDDDSKMPPETQWSPRGQHNGDDSTSPSSAQGAAAPSSQGSKVPPPMQKRRRVTRACDECRRKKIKCDGKQPCTHCTVYSYGQSHTSVCLYLHHGRGYHVLIIEENAPMTSHRTGDEIQLLSILRLWSTVCIEQRLCSRLYSLMLIQMTRT